MICFVLPPREDPSTSEKAEQRQDHHDDKNGLKRHISPPPSASLNPRSPGAIPLRSSLPLSVHAARRRTPHLLPSLRHRVAVTGAVNTPHATVLLSFCARLASRLL